MAKLISADIANNQLCTLEYTTSDGKMLSFKYNAFDAKIVLHTYTDKGKIIFDKPITTIGKSAFRGCRNLTSITIPDSVTEIGDGAFTYCWSLTSVTIGNGVTSIEFCAFYGCSSLTSITIPDSVTSIGDYAFSDCTSLTSAYCKPTTPPAGGSRMFDGNASGRKIYVPRDSVEAYKSASGWGEYAEDIEGYDF